MVHNLLSKVLTNKSKDDKLRTNQKKGRKGQFKRHGKKPKAQVMCYNCGQTSCIRRESLCLGDGGNSI
uniref:Uncharacterized protein n=1 Tax=Brassica campestris TaxID=3711 RepID=A0A3P5YUH3_BRACM|nr:unnamed protein product [Brassica rapa]